MDQITTLHIIIEQSYEWNLYIISFVDCVNAFDILDRPTYGISDTMAYLKKNTNSTENSYEVTC